MAKGDMGKPYRLSGTVSRNYLDKWRDEGYGERYDGAARERVLEKTSDRELIARKMVDVSKYKVGGSTVALRKVFGDLVDDATQIRVRGGRELPITRGDKRVVLSEREGRGIEDIGVGEKILVTLLGASVDRIRTARLSYSVYVKGVYDRPGKQKREVAISGKMSVTIGTELPEGRGDEFWDEVYGEILDDVTQEFKDRLTDQEEFSPGDWYDNFEEWTVERGLPSQTDLVEEARR